MEDIASSWRQALNAEFEKPYFVQLESFLCQEREKYKNEIYPPIGQEFSWMQYCNINDVKVVILGQDPYHKAGQANGLCFSVNRYVNIPRSLLNIFKELENDIPEFNRPSHGDLTKWARQGVLLLNAVLTVRDSKPNSHKNKGWETFTDTVVSWINTHLRNVVFMLWGKYAQEKGSQIDKIRHLVLEASHPSPLSARISFLGCKHFSLANKYLHICGVEQIDWTLE